MKKILNLVMLVFLIVLVFSDMLARLYSEVFKYTDELLIIVISLVFLIKVCIVDKKICMLKEEKNIIISYLFLFFIGIIGNLISNYQSSQMAIALDFFSCLKFFWIYVCVINIFKNIFENKENSKLFFSFFPKIVIILACIIEILLIIKYRGNLKNILSFSFGGHPYFAAAVISCCISVLCMNVKDNLIYIILGSFVDILTFRAKAYGFLLMMFFAILFLKKKIHFSKIVFLLPLLIILTRKKIIEYFFTEGASRGVLLRMSLKISKAFFPIGSGFATFGTIASGQYYSKVYYIYRLNRFWGYSPKAYSFITDGGWAGIIGEFGIIGIILFIYMIYNIIISIKKRVNLDNNLFPYIGILGYLFISSTNENAFFSNYSIIYSVMLGLIVCYYSKGKEIK